MNDFDYPSKALDQRRVIEGILRRAFGVTEWQYLPTGSGSNPKVFIACMSDSAFAQIAKDLESKDVRIVRVTRLPRDIAGYVDLEKLSAGIPASPAPHRRPLEREEALLDGGPLVVPAGEPATLAQALERAAKMPSTYGVTVIDACGRETYTSYQQLYHKARTLAGSLRAEMRDGYQHAVICCSDRAVFLRAFWACQLAGLVAVPCETQGSSLTDPLLPLLGILDVLGGALVLQGDAERGWAGDPRIPARCPVLTIPSVDAASDTPLVIFEPQQGDVALLLSTSGSTGVAKLVMQTHASLLGYAVASIVAFDFGADMVSLNWLPLTHVGGLVMYHVRDVLACARQVVVDTDVILRRPVAWLELMGRHRVTNSWAPNFAYALVTEDLRRHPELDVDLSSLTFLLNGGELISASQATAFLTATGRFGLQPTAMVPAWGMSETCSGVLYGSRVIPSGGAVPVGTPLPGCSVRIVDDSGSVVRYGERGELQVRGRSVLSGYYRCRDANAASFTTDGWFHTGDIAVIDGAGVTILGRIKDTLIVNGRNLSASDVEKAAETVDEVEPSHSAAVAIRGEEDTTDRILLLVVARPDITAEVATTAAAKAVERLTGLRPTWVRAVDCTDIPKTALGKIKRQEIHKIWSKRLMAGNDAPPVLIHVQAWQPFQPRPRAKQANALLVVNAVPRSTLGLNSIEDVRVVDAQEVGHAGMAGAVKAACADLPNDREPIELILAVRGASDATTRGDNAVLSLINGLRAVGDVLSGATATRPVRFTLLLCEVDGSDDLLWVEPVQAMVRCMAAENRALEARTVRVARGADVATILRASFSPHELSLTGNQLSTRVIVAPSASAGTTANDRSGVYVVTGGLGELGHRLCHRLIDRDRPHLIILGRRKELSAAQRDRLESLSARTCVTYLNWSGIDQAAAALRTAIAGGAERGGPTALAGIFHLAGTLGYGPLDADFSNRLEEAWEAKAVVADALIDLAREHPGCTTVFFSSLTVQFGGVNVAAHAASNGYLDAACERANAQGNAPVYAIDWSVWADLGQSAGRTHPEIAKLNGFEPLSADAGFAALDHVLRHPPGVYLAGLRLQAPLCAWRSDAFQVLNSLDRAPVVAESASGTRLIDGPRPPVSRARLDLLRAANSAEDDISSIWRSLLRLDHVAIDDSFFDLGGTSLLVPQVVEAVEMRFGVKLKAVDIFRYPTVSTLATHVSRIMVG